MLNAIKQDDQLIAVYSLWYTAIFATCGGSGEKLHYPDPNAQLFHKLDLTYHWTY